MGPLRGSRMEVTLQKQRWGNSQEVLLLTSCQFPGFVQDGGSSLCSCLMSLLHVYQLESTKEVTTDSSDQGPAPGFGHGVYLEVKATRKF